MAAVREAVGPWPALRVDANGAWSVDEAVRAIRAIEDHDLEFVEQPCRRLRELAEVRQRVSTPIAADESVASMRELRRALELEACDVVNVKLAGAGGFTPARELLREARSAGLDAFLSSTLDGPWGIAAALQLAGLRGPLARLRARDARALRRPHRAGAPRAAARHAVRAGRPRPRRPGRPGGARRGDGRGAGLGATDATGLTLAVLTGRMTDVKSDVRGSASAARNSSSSRATSSGRCSCTA